MTVTQERLMKIRELGNFAVRQTKSTAWDLASEYSNLMSADYTKEDILSAIEDSDLETLREFSSFLYLTNSYYRMSLMNIEGGSLLHYILTPVLLEEQDQNTILTNHSNISAYTSSIMNKRYLREMFASYLLFGAYFGYQFKSGKKYYVQRLDHNYCRLGNQIDGQDVVEFNFDYFEDADDEKFEYFPKEFKTLYTQASSNDDMWLGLEVKNTIALYTQNCFPLLSGSFTSFLDEDIAVALTMDSLEADNMKMITMELPVDEESGDVLADLDVVGTFTNMILESVDDSISVIMSPYKLGFKTFEDTKMSGSSDKRDYLKHRMMESAVASPALFGQASTIAGYNTYYKMLESIIQVFLDQLSHVFESKINNVSSKSITYRLEFLNVTIWNKSEWYAASKEMLSFGGSVSLPAMISTGMNAETYASLLKFEEVLGIKDLLVPPSTSHTGGGETETDSVGSDNNESQTEGGESDGGEE